jgi:hypothetical protein
MTLQYFELILSKIQRGLLTIQRIFTTHAFKIIVYDSITETVVSWLK